MDNENINYLAFLGMFFAAYAGQINWVIFHRSAWDRPAILDSRLSFIVLMIIPNIIGTCLIIFYGFKIYSGNGLIFSTIIVVLPFIIAMLIESKLRNTKSAFIMFFNNSALAPIIFESVSIIFELNIIF